MILLALQMTPHLLTILLFQVMLLTPVLPLHLYNPVPAVPTIKRGHIHPASRGVAAHTAGLFRSVRGAKGGFPPWGLPKLRIFTFPPLSPPWGLPKLGNFHFSPPWGLPKLGNFHFSPPWGLPKLGNFHFSPPVGAPQAREFSLFPPVGAPQAREFSLFPPGGFPS